MAIRESVNGLGLVSSAEGEPTANEVAYILKELQNNAYFQREQWVREFLDPRRDIAKECGYPGDPTIDQYRFMWQREPIAARVVSVMARESWQTSPEVYEKENTKTTTPFEQAWDDLSRALRGESWYGDQEGSPVWEILARADILSGVGQFGVVLLGLDDGKDLSEPAEFVKNSSGSRRLLFLRAFDQTLVNILQYETDKKSPRFGQPTMYQVMMADPKEASIAGTALGTDLGNYNVHWTRIAHLADVFHQACSSEILAVPRMRVCYNRLYDLYKTYGGSAEGYWQGAFPGISFETHPQLGGDVDIDETQMREQLGKYFNRLQRYMVNSGMTAKSLAPQYVDPTPQIEAALNGICIVLGIPKRVFMGSERGELASSQDDMAWNDRLRQRQREYVTPRILIPFVDRLIRLGILPEPLEYFIKWPNLDSQSDGEKADVALKITQAMSSYVQGGLESMITAEDYLSKVLGYSDDEALAFVKATQGRIEEEDSGGSPLLSLVGGLTGISELFKTAQAGGMSEEQLKQILMLFFKLSEAKADAIIADGLPEPPAPPAPGPIKVKEGEKLLNPDGTPPKPAGFPPIASAKGLPAPKPKGAKPPVTNKGKKPSGGSQKGKRPFVQATENANKDWAKQPRKPKGRPDGGEWGSGGSGGGATGAGKSITPVDTAGVNHADGVEFHYNEGEREYVAKALGVSDDQLDSHIAGLAGVLKGAKVKVAYGDSVETSIDVTVKHEKYESHRTLYPGTKSIFNEGFHMSGETGTGLGTQIFYSQVQAASQSGYKSISTEAVRADKSNGYYTWARLGYEGNVPYAGFKLREAAKAAGKETNVKEIKVSEMMKTAEGRSWWKENGSSFSGTFDLNPNSQSRKVLDAYVQAKNS